MIISQNNIILFDGVCNLCNGLVRFIIQRDPGAKFRFAALQSKRGQELLLQWQLPASDFNSIVYIKRGKYFFKSTAILHILKDLGGIWQLFYAFILMPAFLRDFVYSLCARKRYEIFGRRDTCMAPSTEIMCRFLDECIH